HESSFRCPNHRDEHPSLQVNQHKNVWMCGPCGANGTAWQLAAFLARLDPANKSALNAWLRGKGLLNGKRLRSSYVKREPVAVYEYRDVQANPVARKLRFEPGTDGRSKSFAWQRWESGAWVDGI